MHLVIDSNCLHSIRLSTYLSESMHNIAVLTDYAAMEAYRCDPINSINQSMEMLSKYPKQVVVLKGTKTICGLRGRLAGLTRRMIDRKATADFGDFCQYIQLAQKGDEWHIAQILERGEEAAKQLQKVQDGGDGITKYFEVFQSQFSKQELRDIRTGLPYQNSTITKFVASVALFAGESFEIHPNTGKWPKRMEWPHTFIYRNSILKYLYFFRWIENGSPKMLKPEKIRNDLIDMNFATYATFFDGLMTEDRKLEELHLRAEAILFGLFIPVMTNETT